MRECSSASACRARTITAIRGSMSLVSSARIRTPITGIARTFIITRSIAIATAGADLRYPDGKPQDRPVRSTGRSFFVRRLSVAAAGLAAQPLELDDERQIPDGNPHRQRHQPRVVG